MAQFKVKGADETVENVDILGEVKKVGDVVELTEEQAAPLVEEGKLEAFTPADDGADKEVAPEAPKDGETTPEAPKEGESTPEAPKEGESAQGQVASADAQASAQAGDSASGAQTPA